MDRPRFHEDLQDFRAVFLDPRATDPCDLFQGGIRGSACLHHLGELFIRENSIEAVPLRSTASTRVPGFSRPCLFLLLASSLRRN
jgi:hypothetical protein